ncbi:5998_t:CDS:2 [Funneliformis geosporum]|nr:5998_t:CDS:2 [Funneliformis geosporum]
MINKIFVHNLLEYTCRDDCAQPDAEDITEVSLHSGRTAGHYLSPSTMVKCRNTSQTSSAKDDKAEKPQMPENNIIIDPGNNLFYAISDYEPSSDGSWRLESEDEGTTEEDEGTEEYENDQKSNPKLFWFVRLGEINIKDEIQNKWILDGINISDIFFQFRQSTITKALVESIEGTTLNHIFLIQDSENNGQIIDKQLWDRVIQQVYQEYSPPDPPEDWLSKCNKASKIARKDFKNSKSLLKNWYKSSNKESDNIIFDVFHNMANETLDSSARRKKKFDPSLKGKKPDFEVHVSMNQIKENLLVLEINPTDHARPNKDTLNDLVKLANELKESIDKIIDDGISDNVIVCGILVEGKDRHDFCVINNALEVLLHAQDIVKQSATYCLAHLRGQHTSSSRHHSIVN